MSKKLKNYLILCFTVVVFMANISVAFADYGTGVITTDGVNVRSEPSISAEVIGTVNQGPVTMLRFSGDWVLIRTWEKDRLTGWVNKKFIRAEAG